ncbi:hypothetical protein VNO77_42881 [Canavalia gladiata]|uniref:Uncharacterized protein n=1 Tax=Canavalia gladiata TaxID=3824 RepID=A0AAN9PNZ3_CANGL
MEDGGSRKGYVPVLVGNTEDDIQKIWVNVKTIQHLTIVQLLEQSVDEFGYQKGILRIICDAHRFKAILHNISIK